MDQRLGTVEDVEVKELVRALRKRLGMTQDQVADGSGGKISRTEANKIESGANKASSAKIRRGLATAFDLSFEDVSAYLDGDIDLAQVAARVGRATPASQQDDDPQFPNRGRACRAAADLDYSKAAIEQVRTMSRLPDWAAGAHDLPAREWLKMIESAEALQKRGDIVGARLVPEVDAAPPGVPKGKRRK